MRRLFVALLVLTAACSSLSSDIRVDSRAYAKVDFKALKTYQWLASGAVLADTTGTWTTSGVQLDSTVRAAVNRELQDQGYTQVASGADLTVSLLVMGSREQAAAESKEHGVQGDPTVVTEGCLLIEILDGRTGKLLWHGAVRSTTHQVYDAAQVRARIDYAVNELFQRFPN